MLTSEVRARYGPARFYRLWNSTRCATASERFVHQVALRWERVAELFAEDLAARVRLPEDASEETNGIVVRLRGAGAPAEEEISRDATRQEEVPEPPSADPALDLPHPGAVRARRQDSLVRPSAASDSAVDVPDRARVHRDVATELASASPSLSSPRSPECLDPAAQSPRGRPLQDRPRESTGAAAWFFDGDTARPRALPHDEFHVGGTPPVAPGRRVPSASPPTSHEATGGTFTARGLERELSGGRRTQAGFQELVEWFERRQRLEQCAERSLREWEKAEF